MFVAGLGFSKGALAVMYLGRVIMGLGVGGVDSVVPVYSSELSSDDARGKKRSKVVQSAR
jgi:MFS family permease